MTLMTLNIGERESLICSSYADASRIYSHCQEISGEGASTFPEGSLIDGNGKRIARVSYNGRIWEIAEDKPLGGGALVYCPASAGTDEGRPDIFNAGRESVWGRKCANPHAEGTVEHTVFERGAALARSYMGAAA